MLTDQDSLKESLKHDITEQLALQKESFEARGYELASRLDHVQQFGADIKTAIDELMASLDERLDKIVTDTSERLERDRSELLAALAGLEGDSCAKIADLQQEKFYYNIFICSSTKPQTSYCV